MNFLEFGSVCSGIEAASVAFHPLGWRAAWLAEIEPFPCAVLAHHYPTVQNLGDMTTIARRVLTGEVAAPDVLCGGTPCQAFSVAGLRESLADQRGNLTLKFVELADAIDHVRERAGKPAAVVLWENVPGVLSTKDNAFGCFLAGLAGEDEPLQPPGGRWANAGAVYGPTRAVAWRTLDAQYFGVAQRRRRVFVVASARPGFDPATVLFEWNGLRRDSSPSREARKGTAGSLTASAGRRGGVNDPERDQLITTAHTLRAEGFDASEDGTGRGTPLVPTIAFSCKDHGADASDDLSPTLRAMGHAGSHANAGGQMAVAFNWQAGGTQTTLGYDPGAGTAGTLIKDQTQAVALPAAVRRLTPRECERLQGFPDDYTAITVRGKPAADGPRYKALGNSWAVPCARWIGERINSALETA